MENFANILQDYGLKPQGKLAPMANAKQPAFSTKPTLAANSNHGMHQRSSLPILSDDPLFGGNTVRSFSSGRHNTYSGSDPPVLRSDDVFGAPSTKSSTHIFEDIFKTADHKSASVPSNKAPSSYPVFDAPFFDDDIFGGMPGIRIVDSAFEDVFNATSTAAATLMKNSEPYDDLLGHFGTTEAKETDRKKNLSDGKSCTGESVFDELLPGFRTTDPAKLQSLEDGKPSQHKNLKPGNGLSANILEDPFAVFDSDNTWQTNLSTSAHKPGFFTATTEGSDESSRHLDRNHSSTSSVNPEVDSLHRNGDSFMSSAAPEPFLRHRSYSGLSHSPRKFGENGDSKDMMHSTEPHANETARKLHQKGTSNRVKVESSKPTSIAEPASVGSPFQRHRASQTLETEDSMKQSRQAYRESTLSPSWSRKEASSLMSKAGRSIIVDELWLSIDDMKLVTQPAAGPPPVRSPPIPGLRHGQTYEKSFSEGRSMENSGPSPVDPYARDGFESPDSVLDEFNAFASGTLPKLDADVKAFGVTSPDEEELGSAAAAASGAAMREAIERAEAKLRQAKEAKDRDREEARDARNQEEAPACESNGGENESTPDREEREAEEGDRDARQRWRKEREREEKEGEKQREREAGREQEREKDRRNEMARQRAAVERANEEVREREAQRAAEKATQARVKAERVAVERATAEARVRLERAVAEKARAERKAAAEREKAEKDKMATSREQQGKKEDDLESFFMSTVRPSSAPMQRTDSTHRFPTTQPSNEGLWRNNGSSAANVKKTPSMANMADDLTALFGGPTSGPGTFQEVEGESEERRKARWDRYQRTLQRAARALEEKHQRDLQSVKEQEERHRAGELVDAEIKRWAAGKEGNLRALLSTLQYVLWPECGWQPVSLTDLIMAASVKKVYRKANLCIHPDKVQQKGATNQQKYVAEKVFDLLKEAWNKFNSEEHF